MVKIKICGLRDLDAAATCAEEAVDFVGLNFVPSSKRLVTLTVAQEIAAILPAQVKKVGVFSDPSEVEIDRVTAAIPLDLIQLHGNESPELCQRLASRFQLIKAFSVDPSTPLPSLAAYRPFVLWFLFDGPRPGQSEAPDPAGLGSALGAWGSIVEPWLLAGGLSPENVAQQIRRSSPSGVDVASGVEVNARTSPAKIRAFCRAVREGS